MSEQHQLDFNPTRLTTKELGSWTNDELIEAWLATAKCRELMITFSTTAIGLLCMVAQQLRTRGYVAQITPTMKITIRQDTP